MLTLNEIRLAALSLYRESNPDDLRALLTEALANHRLEWREFLEKSGTLARLAECMVIGGGGLLSEDMRKLYSFYDWSASVGIPKGSSTRQYLELYPALCQCYGVPAVQVEVGVYRLSGEISPNERFAFSGTISILEWGPPSVSLATEAIRESIYWTTPAPNLELTADGWLMLERYGNGRETIIAAVRRDHPDARRFRVRIAGGEWVERDVHVPEPDTLSIQLRD